MQRSGGVSPQDLHPAIPRADYHEFPGFYAFGLAAEESLMCVWCRQGEGVLTVNGRRYRMAPFHYVVVPWGHDAHYEVIGHHVWGIADVHVIPWHDPAVDVEWDVPHSTYLSDLRGVAWRQNRPMAGLEQVLHFQLTHDHPLIEISDYIVWYFQSLDRDATVLHHCAWVLLAEIRNAITAPGPLPYRVRRMVRYIRQHVGEPISVDDLAAEIGCSPSQVNRLCQGYLELSPGQWITRTKMDLACQLLRNSCRQINEIAERVGYSDAFYFSRVFKKHTGLSPRTYRQQLSGM